MRSASVASIIKSTADLRKMTDKYQTVNDKPNSPKMRSPSQERRNGLKKRKSDENYKIYPTPPQLSSATNETIETQSFFFANKHVSLPAKLPNNSILPPVFNQKGVQNVNSTYNKVTSVHNPQLNNGSNNTNRESDKKQPPTATLRAPKNQSIKDDKGSYDGDVDEKGKRCGNGTNVDKNGDKYTGKEKKVTILLMKHL